MHALALLQALALSILANAVPLIAKWLFGSHFAHPLDANLKFLDGRPLLGSSKTVRGIVLSLIFTAAAAPLLGLDVSLGIVVATTAMAGDLLSSFLKRRLGLRPSSRATGLDQIPESLFPLLACRSWLPLNTLDVLAGIVIFLIGEIIGSRVLFRLHLRDRPY